MDDIVDPKWTAERVREALTGRWPDSRYLHVYEAPLDSGRQGCKIDVAVFALWRSDRHEIDAVEVKVSYSDWCKEWRRVEWVLTTHDGRRVTSPKKWPTYGLNNYRGADKVVLEGDFSARRARERATRHGVPPDFEPTVERVVTIDTSKSADWRAVAHRFWIAAPAGLAVKIAQDVKDQPKMSDWGVLAVDGAGTHVLVAPAKRTTAPPPLSHQQWIGVVRTAADCGLQALHRAEARGEQRAREAAQREAQRKMAAARGVPA